MPSLLTTDRPTLYTIATSYLAAQPVGNSAAATAAARTLVQLQSQLVRCALGHEASNSEDTAPMMASACRGLLPLAEKHCGLGVTAALDAAALLFASGLKAS